MEEFNPKELQKLYKPKWDSKGDNNGQVSIIGGSSLFHGAPLLSLKVASRLTDMVFFASPHKPLKSVVSRLKARLSSFIWVPWEEVDAYISKSDAVLIGPGLMRYGRETGQAKRDTGGESYHVSHVTDLDNAGKKTRELTKRLLEKFPNKRWVIDAASLQVMDVAWIPENSILTPNKKEMEMLFGVKERGGEKIKEIQKKAKEYNCVIIAKGAETVVCSTDKCVRIPGGNPGLTKGGTGDVLAGLTVALLAKNDSLLAACAASYLSKRAADELYEKVGPNYNADDLAGKIPNVMLKGTAFK